MSRFRELKQYELGATQISLANIQKLVNAPPPGPSWQKEEFQRYAVIIDRF